MAQNVDVVMVATSHVRQVFTCSNHAMYPGQQKLLHLLKNASRKSGPHRKVVHAIVHPAFHGEYVTKVGDDWKGGHAD